jgi:alpha-ketoglutarate-dependent taurine dioxygenase
MSVTITELGPTTGAEINGLSGHALVDAGVAAECRQLIESRGVVIYREADVSDDDLVAFGSMLGELLPVPMGGHDNPMIQRITRDPSKSKLAAYREGTFHWHIDGTTDEVPNKITMLTARQLSDDDGGDTEFANTYASYLAMSDDERAEIDDLRVVHSFAAAQSLVDPDASDEERAKWYRNPAREHPLVWRRTDGRRSMLIGATAGEIPGLAPEESRELLDRLLAWTEQPQFTVRHKWHTGDLVLWDNTGMLHKAQPYGPNSSRMMHRTTVQGEEAIR